MGYADNLDQAREVTPNPARALVRPEKMIVPAAFSYTAFVASAYYGTSVAYCAAQAMYGGGEIGIDDKGNLVYYYRLSDADRARQLLLFDVEEIWIVTKIEED